MASYQQSPENESFALLLLLLLLCFPFILWFIYPSIFSVFLFPSFIKGKKKRKKFKKKEEGRDKEKKREKAKRIYCATLNALDFKYIRKQLSLKCDFVVAGIPECVG